MSEGRPEKRNHENRKSKGKQTRNNNKKIVYDETKHTVDNYSVYSLLSDFNSFQK